MTRNEWIAETARMYRVHGRWGESLGCLETFSTAGAIDAAVRDADVLDAAHVAPWKDAAPQARATIAYEVEDGVHIAGHLWPKTGDAAFTRRAVAAINAACNAPALTDTAAKVVEAAIKALADYDYAAGLWDAVRAHLAAKQGGAK